MSEVDLQFCHNKLVDAGSALTVTLAAVAFYGYQIKSVEGWKHFGFEDEESYRDSLDIPRNLWYKGVRIGKTIQRVPFDQLQQISSTNLWLLSTIDEETYLEYPWVEEARTLSGSEFAALVTKRNKAGSREPLAVYRCSLPFEAKKVVEEIVRSFRKRYRLSSNGRALELMSVDLQDRAKVIAAVDYAARLISAAELTIEKHKLDIPQVTQYIVEAKRALDEVHSQEIEQSRVAAGRASDKRRKVQDPTERSGSAAGQGTTVGSMESAEGDLSELREADHTVGSALGA